MKTSKHILLIAVMGFVPLAQAQVRTWAFSKDTVYEWQSGTDTMIVDGQKKAYNYSNKISISNTGQALQLDSLFVEKIQAEFQGTLLDITVYDSARNYMQFGALQLGTRTYQSAWNCTSVGSCGRSQNPAGLDTVMVQQNRALYNFNIDAPVAVAKQAASAGIGDTIKYRLIFTTKNGRGRDTLILMGSQQRPTPSSIWSGRGSKNSGISNDRLFDLRGRHVEKLPEGLKAPWAPVVSPKD